MWKEEILLIVGFSTILVFADYYPTGDITNNNDKHMALVEVGEFPFLAHIVSQFGINSSDVINCGATLLSTNWLLTAAHCVRKDGRAPTIISTFIGGFNFTNRRRFVRRRIIDPASVFVHPNYFTVRRNQASYDFALIKLAVPVPLTTRDAQVLKPISLPDSTFGCGRRPFNESTTAFEGCDSLVVVGWGTEGQPKRLSKYLRKVTQTLKRFSTCTAASLGSFSSTKVCAGGDLDVDFCWDNSGSPLVCRSSNGTSYLIGVASYGRNKSCSAATNVPAVYARLCSVLPWVKRIVQFYSTSIIAVKSLPTLSADCHFLPRLRNGHIGTGGSDFGSERTVICKSGFIIKGNSKIQCQDNARWSKPGACVPAPVMLVLVSESGNLSCGSPPKVANGFVKPGDHTVGTSLPIYCFSGFYLSGNAGLTCQVDGTWSAPGNCATQTTTTKPAFKNVPKLVNDVASITKKPIPEMIPWWAILLLSILLPHGAPVY